MGIAGFYQWLQQHYPEAVEEINEDVDANGQGPDGVKENPRVDSLYLDMNGLIHPCCHDTAPLPEPDTEEEMMGRIFDILDHLFRMIRPRKCLCLAVDGVAPRSKMNQQRARRFRSAMERMESNEISRRNAEKVVKEHQLPEPQFRDRWDHNVITPSTAFMERVAQCIEWFVMKKLNEDPLWAHVTVIFSDAHVPGEGEHKIMHFIRGLRATPSYDPNTSHCIYGQDADLIVLSLNTHEVHFSILRNALSEENKQPIQGKYCRFNMAKFRQLLKRDFRHIPDMNFERVIDDFVFLCFFVGNDFLPHCPLLVIKTHGIESLLHHYVDEFTEHGYLTKSGEIRFQRVGNFLRTFVKANMNKLFKGKQEEKRRGERQYTFLAERIDNLQKELRETLASLNEDRSNAQVISNKVHQIYVSMEKENLRVVHGKYPLEFTYGAPTYRDDYYKFKFEFEPHYIPSPEEQATFSEEELNMRKQNHRDEFEEKIRLVSCEYLRGMQWVMRYYTKGCPSWEWYYPYHYAPLLEDMAMYWEGVDTGMALSEPLHPVEQLIAVLPRESASALPEELVEPVLDVKSPLAKFYPHEVDIDYSEATRSYQGVIRLPFINCRKLKRSLRQITPMAPDNGNTFIYCHANSMLAKVLDASLQNTPARVFVNLPPETQRYAPIAGRIATNTFEEPLHGYIDCFDQGVALAFPKTFGMPIQSNKVRSFVLELATFVAYKQELLRGAKELKDFNLKGKKGGVLRGKKSISTVEGPGFLPAGAVPQEGENKQAEQGSTLEEQGDEDEEAQQIDYSIPQQSLVDVLKKKKKQKKQNEEMEEEEENRKRKTMKQVEKDLRDYDEEIVMAADRKTHHKVAAQDVHTVALPPSPPPVRFEHSHQKTSSERKEEGEGSVKTSPKGGHSSAGSTPKRPSQPTILPPSITADELGEEDSKTKKKEKNRSRSNSTSTKERPPPQGVRLVKQQRSSKWENEEDPSMEQQHIEAAPSHFPMVGSATTVVNNAENKNKKKKEKKKSHTTGSTLEEQSLLVTHSYPNVASLLARAKAMQDELVEQDHHGFVNYEQHLEIKNEEIDDEDENDEKSGKRRGARHHHRDEEDRLGSKRRRRESEESEETSQRKRKRYH